MDDERPHFLTDVMPRECAYCCRHGQKHDYANCIYEERKKDLLLCFLHRFGEEKETHKSDIKVI
jgi:hypothetical protein